jgi:hypothetical protein
MTNRFVRRIAAGKPCRQITRLFQLRDVLALRRPCETSTGSCRRGSAASVLELLLSVLEIFWPDEPNAMQLRPHLPD